MKRSFWVFWSYIRHSNLSKLQTPHLPPAPTYLWPRPHLPVPLCPLHAPYLKYKTSMHIEIKVQYNSYSYFRSTRGSCITSCFVNSSVTSYTVTELDPGNSEIITVKAYVQYPGQDILAGASLDISVATLPDTPDIITVSTTNESITFQLEVPSGFCHGFLVL